ncbi:hypothetical protein Tco_0452144 [Tanacetum coccineum]
MEQNFLSTSIDEVDEEMKVCPILREAVSWKLGGDVESLRDELAKLKLAKEVLFCPCGATTILEDKEKMWSFYNQVEGLDMLVSCLGSKVVHHQGAWMQS